MVNYISIPVECFGICHNCKRVGVRLPYILLGYYNYFCILFVCNYNNRKKTCGNTKKILKTDKLHIKLKGKTAIVSVNIIVHEVFLTINYYN